MPKIEQPKQTPEEEGKRKYPFITGFIAGFVGALGVTALLLQITVGLRNVFVEGPAGEPEHALPLPVIAAASAQPLEIAAIADLLDDLSARLLVTLRKSDDSIQVFIDDPRWPSQAWTTAQALVAVLSTPQSIVSRFREEIRKAASFVRATRNHSGGWQKYVGQGPSVVEPTAWATLLSARLATYPGFSPAGDREEAASACEQNVADLLAFRDTQSGGFRTVLDPHESARSTYGSVLALHALLEARGVVPRVRPLVDEAISGVIPWILRQEVMQDGRCRYRASASSSLTEEPLGLALQTVYTLSLARRAGYQISITVCENALLEELLNTEHDPRADYAINITAPGYAETAPGYAKSLRTMWYPWAVLWVHERLRPSVTPAPPAFQLLKTKLLDRRVVQHLINSFGADETFRVAETLLALGTLLQD